MLFKKPNAATLESVTKTVFSGLAATAAVTSDLLWKVLEASDSKSSASYDTEDNPQPFNCHYGSVDNNTPTGWALTHTDDEGNCL